MEKWGVSFAKHAQNDFRERSTALIHTQPSPRQGQILHSKVLVEISSISAKIVFLVVSFACAKERHNKVESSAKFNMKEAFSPWMVLFPSFHSCQKSTGKPVVGGVDERKLEQACVDRIICLPVQFYFFHWPRLKLFFGGKIVFMMDIKHMRHFELEAIRRAVMSALRIDKSVFMIFYEVD